MVRIAYLTKRKRNPWCPSSPAPAGQQQWFHYSTICCSLTANESRVQRQLHMPARSPWHHCHCASDRRASRAGRCALCITPLRTVQNLVDCW